jgi:hypothetical protein
MIRFFIFMQFPPYLKGYFPAICLSHKNPFRPSWELPPLRTDRKGVLIFAKKDLQKAYFFTGSGLFRG